MSPQVPATTAEWQQRSLRAVWHPCTQMQRAAVVPPLPIARGEGPWLIDFEGTRYFDATSSWWVMNKYRKWRTWKKATRALMDAAATRPQYFAHWAWVKPGRQMTRTARAV